MKGIGTQNANSLCCQTLTANMAEDYGVHSIVIDNGTCSMKGGFGGDDGPKVVFPTVVGYQLSSSNSQPYVSNEALKFRERSDLKYPVELGSIVNWEDMEHVWKHLFYDALCVAPEEHPVLLTESPFDEKRSRDKTFHSMFETFNCPVSLLSLLERFLDFFRLRISLHLQFLHCMAMVEILEQFSILEEE
jgi:actin-related protein